MAIIRYQHPAGDQSVLPVPEGGILVGRSGDCHLRLQSPGVSRRHAQILRSQQQVVLEDLGSRNGTFLNGCRISRPRPLRDGDRISVCGVRLIFHAGSGLEQSSGSWGNRPAGIWMMDRAEDGSVHQRRIEAGEPVPIGAQRTSHGVCETELVRRPATSEGLRSIRAEAVAAVAFVGQFQDRFRGCIRRSEVYSTLMESVLELFPACDSCLVSRFDPDSRSVVVVAAVTRDPGQDVTLCHSVVADSIHNNQLILRAEHWCPRPDVPSEVGALRGSLRHVLCLPVSERDSVIAVLQLVSGQQEPALDAADAERLTMLSSAISLLVCNAEEAERHFVTDDRGDRTPVPRATVFSGQEQRPALLPDPKGHP